MTLYRQQMCMLTPQNTWKVSDFLQMLQYGIRFTNHRNSQDRRCVVLAWCTTAAILNVPGFYGSVRMLFLGVSCKTSCRCVDLATVYISIIYTWYLYVELAFVLGITDCRPTAWCVLPPFIRTSVFAWLAFVCMDTKLLRAPSVVSPEHLSVYQSY